VLHRGSSIRVTHSSNCHILTLKSDAKLFDEVLKPLQAPKIISKTFGFVIPCDGMEIDYNSLIKDVALLDLYEYVLFIFFFFNNFSCKFYTL